MAITIQVVNPNDRNFYDHRFIFAFSNYGFGAVYLMTWGDGFESCFEEAGDWLRKNAPGLLATEEVNAAYVEAYDAAIVDGMDEEDATEHACSESEVDVTPIGGYGDWIASDRWQIVAEDPTRADVLALQGRTAKRAALDRLSTRGPPHEARGLARANAHQRSIMAKKKAVPLSETRREYCRALYAVACDVHARNLAELAIASDVLAWMLNLADHPGRDLFDRVHQASLKPSMERKVGKSVPYDETCSFLYHLSFDILSPYVPIAADCRGFLFYLENVQREADDKGTGEWWTDDARASIIAAIDGVHARREADPPTFARVVAKDDERVAKLATARSDDETAHIRAASS